MTTLHVISPGVFSNLQDSGRHGYQDMGVPPSGAMDFFLHALANHLVGNDANTAVLEFTVTGGQYRIQGGSCRLSVVGDVDVAINGETVPSWSSYTLTDGNTLKIGTLRTGLRGYLAVYGGFDVSPVMGSVSTLSRAALGGFHGRALKKEDVIPLCQSYTPNTPCLRSPVGTCLESLPWQRHTGPLRIVLGPQVSAFTEQGIQSFLHGEYKILPASDRMGYRLNGPSIEHSNGHDIITDAIALGAIQVAGDAQPIIALHDRQTTGGYPKIAVVARADMSRLVQLRPGASLSWQAISVNQAVTLWQETLTAASLFFSSLAPTT